MAGFFEKTERKVLGTMGQTGSQTGSRGAAEKLDKMSGNKVTNDERVQDFNLDEIRKILSNQRVSKKFDARQNQLSKMLMKQAQGKGPSLAQAIVDQNRGAGQANILAQANSQRGVSAGLAARLAGQQQNALNQQSTQQALTGRLQEQQNAQGQLGQVLAQGRAGDLAAAQFNAGTNQSLINAIMQEEMQQRELNNQLNKQAMEGRQKTRSDWSMGNLFNWSN